MPAEKAAEPRCRHCGSTDAVPIAYGLAGLDGRDAEERGEIVLGGCCISPGQPTHRCRSCGGDFADRDRYGPSEGPARLGPRFDRALDLAAELHREQVRKGSGVPYLSHLLAVCAIVLEEGGDEDEAIAALLHDAAEDQGGEMIVDLIRGEFGDRVAAIVAACSDTFEQPKPPALERKREYVVRLDSTDTLRSTLLVSAADKLANLRAIIDDHARVGAAVWKRFKLTSEQQLWYYRSLADVYRRRLGGRLAEMVTVASEDLARVVEADAAGHR